MKDLACRLLFGEAEGDEIHRRVELAVGGPCPCFVGRTCPMLDFHNDSPLLASHDQAVRPLIPVMPVQRTELPPVA